LGSEFSHRWLPWPDRDGRKRVVDAGLLRNSTIFRCAKNWDSGSARRKLPASTTRYSCGPIVPVRPRQPPALTSVPVATWYCISRLLLRCKGLSGDRRSQTIRPRSSRFPRWGFSASTVRVQKIAQQFLSSCAAAHWGILLAAVWERLSPDKPVGVAQHCSFFVVGQKAGGTSTPPPNHRAAWYRSRHTTSRLRA